MKKFFKMTLAAMLGFFIMSIVFSLFTFAIFGSIAAMDTKTVVMPKNAVLVIDMSKIALSEQSIEADPFTSLQNKGTTNIGIWDAIQAINAAQTDADVKYIYLKADGAIAGIAHLEEFRSALVNFRTSGKPIVAYMNNPSNAGYYLSSAADKIYMTKYNGGMNMLHGLSSSIYFLKDLLDELGVNVQLIRHGKYKSAGETYISNTISPANKEQNQVMISSLWKTLGGEMAASREIEFAEFNKLLDNLELNLPEDFLKAGLVDKLVTNIELQDQLTILSGTKDYYSIGSISLADYKTLRVVPNYAADDKIAIIYADGNIMPESSKNSKVVSGKKFASLISAARRDSSVKAVVFRINSPGGSVLEAEQIKTEIDSLRKVKPVVASYGLYAASGGYWISANSDYIISNASTLTGSIGVFSMIPSFGKTVKDIAHLNIATIKSNEHADIYSGMRDLTKEEEDYMQASVENIYDQFTSIVSQGRGMNVADVDEIAQGRVWAGSDALEINLVDQIGTIEDAIAKATELANSENGSDLSKWQIVEYPKPLTAMESIMAMFEETSDNILGKANLKSLAAGMLVGTPLQGAAEAFNGLELDKNGMVMARIPYEFVIE